MGNKEFLFVPLCLFLILFFFIIPFTSCVKTSFNGACLIIKVFEGTKTMETYEEKNDKPLKEKPNQKSIIIVEFLEMIGTHILRVQKKI